MENPPIHEGKRVQPQPQSQSWELLEAEEGLDSLTQFGLDTSWDGSQYTIYITWTDTNVMVRRNP